MSTPAKQYHQDMLHYLRADLTVTGAGETELGVLPSGCTVLGAAANITTILNGATPGLTVGTNASDYNNLLGSSDIVETTLGPHTNHDLALPIVGDTTVVAKVTSSGTATTAGVASLYILYAPDNR